MTSVTFVPSFGATYSPGATETDVNEAVGQALGVTLKELAENDELEWTKAGVGFTVHYGLIGINSTRFANAADDLNSALSSYGSFDFTVEYVYDGSLFRPRRFAVCVDSSNKTVVLLSGDRQYGVDDWGNVIIVGKETETVYRMFKDKCGSDYFRAGPLESPCIAYVWRNEVPREEVLGAVWAFFDPVKLEWHFGSAAAFADPDTPHEYVLKTNGW